MPRTADDIHFDALRNAIYHSSRRGFLDTINRALSFVVVATGSAAVANLVYWGWLDSRVFAGVAALAGLAQLVFDFGGKARTHEFLQRRFYELVAEISECLAAEEKDCARWDASLNRLYAEEPPPMRALDAISFNAAADSLGRQKLDRVKVTSWESLLRHLWPYNEKSFY